MQGKCSRVVQQETYGPLTIEDVLFQHEHENTTVQLPFGPPFPHLGHRLLFGAGLEFWISLGLSSATLAGTSHADRCEY